MILIAILLTLVLLGGYWGFRYACARLPDPDWTSSDALKKTMWAPYANDIPRHLIWLENHNAEDVSIQSFDGLTLRGKWVPAEHPRGTIILFHGYHSSYLTDFGGIFDTYHKMGFHLLMVRQRAHGESEGKYITFGVRERKDVLSWVDFHNRTHGMDNVFLSGMSMGTSTVLFAAGEELPANVRGITADCGFTCPAEIMSHVFETQFHLPAKPVLPLVALYARLLGGFGLRECHTAQTMARCKKPVLFIHGMADTYVPCHMTRTAYDACISEKTLVLVEGAEHGLSFLVDRERVLGALTNFFDRHISPEFQEVTP